MFDLYANNRHSIKIYWIVTVHVKLQCIFSVAMPSRPIQRLFIVGRPSNESQVRYLSNLIFINVTD